MKISHAGSRKIPAAAAAAALCLLVLAIRPARAQQAGGAAQPVITIDGAIEPDRVPDWILWRELFSVAAMLADKAADGGQDIWMNRLGLSRAQMDLIIAHGRALGDEEKQLNREARAVVSAARGVIDGPTKSRLHQMEADKESRLLVRRDQLRARIGADAVQRLQAFARMHIAPTIKVGTMEPSDK
jgi:hypothetical protein